MLTHRQFFDLWSRFYETTPLLGGVLRAVQREAIGRLNLPPGARVLDLGCGPGLGLTLLEEVGYHATGGDHSPRMAARAARRHRRVVRLDATALPFREAFDGIVSTNAFHHFPDASSGLREMRRVLRPGGKLVLADPYADDVFARLAIHVGERRLLRIAGVHLHSRRSWAAMLERCGFTSVRTTPMGRWDPRRRAILLVEAIAA